MYGLSLICLLMLKLFLQIPKLLFFAVSFYLISLGIFILFSLKLIIALYLGKSHSQMYIFFPSMMLEGATRIVLPWFYLQVLKLWGCFAALRRYEAARWLRKTVGVVGGKDLPAEPSEEEFRLGLRSGIILCNIINKVQPGAIPKVWFISILIQFSFFSFILCCFFLY